MSPVRIVKTRRFNDDRGWFSEVYNQQAFVKLGINAGFVQDNHSFSLSLGTIRGLHFQRPPHAQDKLVRCIRGRIYDVAVDVRRGSPTYGKYVGEELSAENGLQLFIPAGFAHGFATLEPDCEITYKVSDIYAPQTEGGLRWNDAALDIDWHLPARITPSLSAKDAILPALAEFDSPFAYDGCPLEDLVT